MAAAPATGSKLAGDNQTNIRTADPSTGSGGIDKSLEITNEANSHGRGPMTPFTQLEANRRNPRRSTGPTTVGGKQCSRRNAVETGTEAFPRALRDEFRRRFEDYFLRKGTRDTTGTIPGTIHTAFYSDDCTASRTEEVSNSRHCRAQFLNTSEVASAGSPLLSATSSSASIDYISDTSDR